MTTNIVDSPETLRTPRTPDEYWAMPHVITVEIDESKARHPAGHELVPGVRERIANLPARLFPDPTGSRASNVFVIAQPDQSDPQS